MRAVLHLPLSQNKLIATTLAEAFCKGIVTHHIHGDFGPEFVATRGPVTKSFQDVHELRAWISVQPNPVKEIHG